MAAGWWLCRLVFGNCSLFGESDLERRQRLIRVETEHTTADDEGFELGAGHDIRNPFLESGSKDGQKASKVSKGNEDDDDEDDDEEEDSKGEGGRYVIYVFACLLVCLR